jgi:hypothetical protein
VIRLLVVFDRTGRTPPRYGHLGAASATEATSARLAAEEAFGGPDVEVAVLSAADVDAMRHTHARYFPDPARP